MNWKGLYAFSVIRSQSAGFRHQGRLAMEQKAVMKTEAGHRWLWLLLIVIVAVAMVMIPAALIMPFRRQTPFGVELSWLLRRWSPVVTITALIAALAVVVSLWRRSKGFVKRAAMIVLVLPLIAATWFARQNHFEWMFQPLHSGPMRNCRRVTLRLNGNARLKNCRSSLLLRLANQGLRTLMAGLVIEGQAVACPVAGLKRQRLIIDTIKQTSVFLISLDEGRSIRAFERRVDGRTLEFFASTEAALLRLVDAETGSLWDFTGAAVSGQLAGRQLKKIAVLKDYWLDWKTYHSETAVYTFGARAASKPE